MMYEKYRASDDSDRTASSAMVLARLSNWTRPIMMVTTKRVLVGMRNVGWTWQRLVQRSVGSKLTYIA